MYNVNHAAEKREREREESTCKREKRKIQSNVAQKISLVDQAPHLSTLEYADVASFADKLQVLVTNDHACAAFSSK